MRIFRSLDELPADWNSTVVSIGNFDGVHRAHRKVLARVAGRARELGAHSVAVTFDPHPLRVLRPESAPALISPLPQRIASLKETGIDATLVLPFTQQLAAVSPREFVQKIVVERLRAKEVHEGASFHFGHRAEGNCEILKELGREFGFAVTIYPEMHWRKETVSSSRIRQLLAEGNVTRARHLLDRPFSVVSTPARGRGYGTRYTVPTINLAPYRELVPRNGVYITCTRVADESFESVTNIGHRPTFDGHSFAIETHLLNFHQIALDEQTEVEITFLKWLRTEVKWPDPEALKQQIGRDVARARRFFTLVQGLEKAH
ncbi:MAG: bifunctional riboflavin kinase/FMN adenylyltransferase [Acidobacteria bacterium]|nr:MAG: bifunctional riboflavin kinase/FMN adenylyltransferase [Acidobacteriota bacterium]